MNLKLPRSATRREARVFWLVPAGIVVLGLVLRLYRLDHESLWYDELFSVGVSSFPWKLMHESLIKDVVHPPLHYYVLHLWLGLFGVGPVQARLVSVIFGTLSIPMLYVLVRELFDARTASLSALLLAISQFAIRYSQEARPYAQFLFFVLGSSYLFLRSLRSKRAIDWWLFIACAAAVILTHYYGFFVLAAFAIFAFLYRSRYPIPAARWIGGTAILGSVFAVWLASGVLQEAVHSSKTAFGRSNEHWYTILTIFNIFNNGRVNGFPEPAPWWSFLLGGLLFSLPAVLGFRRVISRGQQEQGPVRRENSVFFLLLCCLPILLALGMGTISVYYDVRYVLFCSAFYYVLVARGLTLLSRAALRNALIVLGVGYSIYALRADYFIPYKENHQSALLYLADHARAGDCYVATPAEVRQIRWAWSVYEPDRPELTLMPLDSARLKDSSCARVWLISVTTMNEPIKLHWSQKAHAQLQSDYAHTDRQAYFWVGVDLYEAHPREVSSQTTTPRL